MIKLPTFDNLFSPPRSSSSRVTTATTFSRQNEAIEKVVLVIESKGLRAGPAFVLLSEVERKEALSKSGDPIGVAEARTSGFNRQTGFLCASDCLLIHRWP